MSKSTYRPKAINWTVTLYADPKFTLEQKEAWFDNKAEFKYAIFGREVCPETQRKHLQGFVSCHNQKLLTGMKKLFPDGIAHFEIAKGTCKHNKDYCSKVCDYL